MNKGKTKCFTGIADAHGLESFKECTELGMGSSMLTMRASFNRQRHALVYWVELDATQQETIEELLADADNDDRFMDACRLLHDPNFIENVSVEQQMLRSWGMLPNHDLDPYWG